MDSWEQFDEAAFPDNDAFYSNVNTKNIKDVDYRHAKRVFKDVHSKNLGGYHNLYVQSDTLLLEDVFEVSRNKCIWIYELDPAHFMPGSKLAWQTTLKKTGTKLELSVDNGISVIVAKRIRGGICHAIHRYAKSNNKYIKSHNRNSDHGRFFWSWEI